MICFVIAMDKEAEPVIGVMKVKSDKKICGKRVICGTLYGIDAAIVVCGVGKVNAAYGAALAVSLLKAEAIVNVGVAGGLNGGVEVGKIYEIACAVQYDFDLTQLNGTKIGTLDEFNDNYLPLASPAIYPQKQLGTGDRFNDSPADYKLLTDELGADIRDMEGGAIAHVCLHANVPCFEFKIISDLAGSGSTTEQYLHNLSLCFETLKRELKNIILTVSATVEKLK